MPSTTFERPEARTDTTQHELKQLAQFIKDRFPEEAASADLTDSRCVVEATIELLERLWRWER